MSKNVASVLSWPIIAHRILNIIGVLFIIYFYIEKGMHVDYVKSKINYFDYGLIFLFLAFYRFDRFLSDKLSGMVGSFYFHWINWAVISTVLFLTFIYKGIYYQYSPIMLFLAVFLWRALFEFFVVRRMRF